MPTVGFIGLGVMGGPMARRLAAKCAKLVVYDVDAEKVEALTAPSICAARTVAEVGRAAQVVFLSLPGSEAVMQVVLGEEGLAENMQAGGTVIDTSTTAPSTALEVAHALEERGLRFLDAPVSGGERAAIDGTLSIFVGGSREVLEDCRALLETLGTTITYIGKNGMGQLTKLANNMIVGATFAIVAEAFAFAAKAGLDPALLYEAIRNGWAGSRVLDVAAPAMLERNFKPGGTVNIHAKDLGYALSVARDLDIPTPVTAVVHEIFKAARACGKGPLSQPAIVMLWEELLGLQVAGQGGEKFFGEESGRSAPPTVREG